MQTTTPLTEESLFDLLMGGFIPSRVAMTAVQVGIFDAIEAGATTAETIAEHCECDPRATRMLLDTTTALGMCQKADGRYSLGPLTQKLLVSSSPNYIGALVQSNVMWDRWSHLTETVRTGEPVAQVESPGVAAAFFPSLVAALHLRNRRGAQLVAQWLKNRLPAFDARVLDVACGSGVWSIAIAEACPQSHVTANDFPALLERLPAYLEPHGLTDRYSFLAGDLKAVDFGEEQFHAAILGNIVHSEGEAGSRKLLQQLHRAMKPGGHVVIVDMVPNDERSAPVYPLAFALNMLLNTRHGDTFTLAEYTEWLHDAGFKRVETVDVQMHSPVIVGSKI